VLEGGRLNQRLLVVSDSHTLGEQLRGEPARDVNRLPLAVATPRTNKLQFRH